MITEEGVTEPDCTFTTSDLPIDSIRLGEENGTHTIAYDSEEDSITITHSAHSRKGFALGAVLAAEYTQQNTGLLGINNLFNF